MKPALRQSLALLCFTLAALGTLASGAALAQGSEAKPIRFLVPTSPGSEADGHARAFAERLQSMFKQSVLVENRMGAGGSLAAAALANSAPNGETIGILGNSYLLFGVEFPSQKFNPARDVVPVALLTRGGNVLLVRGDARFATLQELVAHAKANPDKLNFASAGVGSSTYRSAERLRTAAGFKATHVPFKGSPEAVLEVMAGRVDFAFAPFGVATTFLQSGKVRALAVSTSRRAPLWPEVPTTIEAGYANSNYEVWLVALVPAATPLAVQARLNQQFNAAVGALESSPGMAQSGSRLEQMSLTEVQKFVQAESVSALELEKQSRSAGN